MYRLHFAPSTAAMSAHWLLIELGVPHTLQRVDLAAGEHKQPAYLALNPAGVVPTLEVDGQPLCESAAIVMWLAERHAEAGLSPAPGTAARSQYLQWMFFLANTLQPAYRAWFYPHEAAGEACAEAAKQAARERIEAAWARVDAHLAAHGPYLVGTQLSAADFHATMLMRWSRNMPRPAHTWPALGAYAALMKSRPSFKVLYEREGVTDWT
jgi:glutathione S-transferase